MTLLILPLRRFISRFCGKGDAQYTIKNMVRS
jgi:hypothetical protein